VKKTLPIQALIACINAVLSLIVTQLNASEVVSLNEKLFPTSKLYYPYIKT